jgi:hypothetical protein
MSREELKSRKGNKGLVKDSDVILMKGEFYLLFLFALNLTRSPRRIPKVYNHFKEAFDRRVDVKPNSKAILI